MVMRVSCSNFSNTSVKIIENKEEFKNETENKKEKIDYKEETEKENINSPNFLFGINHNSALENLKENTEIKDRIDCFSAPLWWYPKDSYDPQKFKSKYYPDYFDKNLNYWGSAQERFWDFNSVLNTFTII
jgi:hypothetical protein